MTMTATIVRSPHARYGCLHTPDELFEQLRREGFLLYRENFMWGRTDGFRHADGRCLYVEQGVIRTPEQQYRQLMASWHPLRRDERDYQCRCAAAGKLLSALQAIRTARRAVRRPPLPLHRRRHPQPSRG